MSLGSIWHRGVELWHAKGAGLLGARNAAGEGAGSARARWPQDGTQCLAASPPALQSYRALRRAVRALRAAEERLARAWPHGALLLADLFLAFYDPSAELRAGASPAVAKHFSLLAALMATPRFRKMRETTQHDAVLSAVAAIEAAEAFVAVLVEEERAGRRLARLLGARIRREVGEALPASRGTGRAEAVARFEASRAAARAEEALASLTEARQTWGILPGQKGAQALDDVLGLLEEIKKLKGWNELTDALRRFRKLLGAAPSWERADRRRLGFDRLAGYTWGRDLNRLAPEEAVKMADPATAGLFGEAYEHGRLLELDFRGRARKKPGLMICCMDTSASMNAPSALGRERFLWCKGAGLALLDYARRERRPFLGICFSSESDLAAFSFSAGGFRPEDVIEMARCDFNGGTHFERPLAYALDALKAQPPRERRGPDLVFIADGEASVRRAFALEFARRKREAGLRMFSVFIDGFNEQLAALSDASFLVDSGRVDSWEAAVRSVGKRLSRS